MSTDLRLRGLPADDPRSIPADTPHNPTANALPTPEHGGSLAGTTDYRSLEGVNEGSARTGCNNPADRSKFFAPGADADDPRAPSWDGAERHFQLPRSSGGNVPGSAATALADEYAPARWPDTSLALVAETTPAPGLDTRGCSNTSAHSRAEKNFRNLPAGTDEPAAGRADLEIPGRMTYGEEGPREVLLPTGQVSDGSSLLPSEAVLSTWQRPHERYLLLSTLIPRPQHATLPVRSDPVRDAHIPHLHLSAQSPSVINLSRIGPRGPAKLDPSQAAADTIRSRLKIRQASDLGDGITSGSRKFT